MEDLLKRMIARNVRHKMADMFASQWTGIMDTAMNEMVLDAIDSAVQQLEDERKEK